MNCEDKAIQINKVVDVEIVNNKFVNCHIPITITVADNVKVKNNNASCNNLSYSRDDGSVSDLNYSLINHKIKLNISKNK